MLGIENWKKLTEQKLEEVSNWANQWQPERFSTDQEALAIRAEQQNRHGAELRKEALYGRLIYGGIEIKGKGDSHFTPLYVSFAHNIDIRHFPEDIVPYSSKFAGILVKLKDALLKGQTQARILDISVDSCADIESKGNKLDGITYYKSSPAGAIEYWPKEREKPERETGLTRIHQTVDVNQDELVRKRITGVTLIAGIPGSGKTSIAIMKIPTILDRQFLSQDLDPKDIELLPKKLSQASPAFKAENIVVFIRANHLKNYLRDFCNQHLVPSVRILDYNAWLIGTVRQYVNELSKLANRTTPTFPQDSLASMSEAVSSAFDEMLLLQIIRDLYSSQFYGRAQRCRERVEKAIQPLEELISSKSTFAQRPELNEIKALISKLLNSINVNDKECDYRIQTTQNWQSRTRNALLKLSDYINSGNRPLGSAGFNDISQDIIDLWTGKVDGSLGKTTRGMSERIAAIFRDALESWISVDMNPMRILESYYISQEFEEQLNSTNNGITKEVKEFFLNRAKISEIHSCELPIFLWILIYLTDDYVPDGAILLSPVPKFDHIVLDETQLYLPYLVRAIIQLARKPMCSLTLCGDIQQGDASKDGLGAWTPVLRDLPLSAITGPVELATGYRWSEQIFLYLEKAASALKLDYSVHFARPKTVKLRDHKIPVEFISIDLDNLVQKASDYCAQIFDSIDISRSETFCAIFPPKACKEQWASICSALMKSLSSRGIPAEFMEGEAISLNYQGIIFTQSDDVVGLEFDHVLVNLPEITLKCLSGELGRRTLWTCLTRPSRSLGIISVDQSDPFTKGLRNSLE